MPLSPGVRLGPYEILSPIGAGGMGEVFLARDTRLERQVAIKTLPPALAGDDDRSRRFTWEAQAAAAITHPNVAAVYDIGASDGIRYIALEFVEGRTLAARLATGPVAIGELLPIAVQLTDAIAAAHVRGIVHRDIKPANVMLTPLGVVKVLDFGLARHVDPVGGDDPTATTLSAPGIAMGTVAYMSPEQARGEPVDHRSDIFSLGVVLYEAVTGRRPFVGSSALHTLRLIEQAEPPPLRLSHDRASEAFEHIVCNCLRKRPADRYQTVEGLGADLRDALRSIGTGRALSSGADVRHNLPEQLSTFLGRHAELEALRQAIASSRLVTLTGAGGCGKTRLALQFAAECVAAFDHGVWFVDLSALSDPELLPQAVAMALQIGERPGRSMRDALIDHLRDREVILVLDNCEHLVDASAGLADLLLRSAPHVRILATSREALGVQGETVWRVPSLGVPPADSVLVSEIMDAAAVRLFIERARASAGFAPTDEDVRVVADICRLLDGIPLAIELAAARVSVLAVDQIKLRLKDRFRLLTAGGRTTVARQRTLEAAVGWSYDLLLDPERRLLERLSTFAGGWTLEAAEQVCVGDGIAADEVVDLLGRLVDKSLVIVDDATPGERRYRLLETIRQFARDRLLASGAVDATSARHFDYFQSLAERAAPELPRARQAEWLNRLHVEHDNLRAALDWASALGGRNHDVLRVTVALWWFWVKRSHFSEGQRRLAAAIAGAADAEADMVAHARIGLLHCALFRGDADCPEMVAKALQAIGDNGSPWSRSYALGMKAIVDSDRGAFEEAEAAAIDARRVALLIPEQESLRQQPLALATRMLAYSALQRGDFEGAALLFNETIRILHELGEVWSSGILLSDLAALRALQARYSEARQMAHEALARCQSVGDRRGVAWSLQAIAMVEAADGGPELAALLYGAALELLDHAGARGQVTLTRVQDQLLARAIETLGLMRFETEVAEGRKLTLPQALARLPSL